MQSTQTNQSNKYIISKKGRLTITPNDKVVIANVVANKTRNAGSSRANWPFVVFLGTDISFGFYG